MDLERIIELYNRMEKGSRVVKGSKGKVTIEKELK